jgi:hypothetical protein
MAAGRSHRTDAGFYVAGLAMPVGGEINATIEHAREPAPENARAKVRWRERRAHVGRPCFVSLPCEKPQQRGF